jgi:hypothetical protein
LCCLKSKLYMPLLSHIHWHVCRPTWLGHHVCLVTSVIEN